MTRGELLGTDQSAQPARNLGRGPRIMAAGGLTIGLLAISLIAFAVPASAAAYTTPVGLGTAAPYSILAGSTATNTGTSTLSGSLGVSPGTTDPGFTSTMVGGATHLGDAPAAQAQLDLTTAYNTTAGLAPTGTTLGAALTNATTLVPGVYNAPVALNVDGTITLDGQGNPASVFVIQVGSALITASNTHILLTGGAMACNVYWQVATSATLGSSTNFVGTIMALASISLGSAVTVQGRALASVGAVTLIGDTFTAPTCTTPTTTTVTATPATTGGTTTLTATVAPTGGATAPTGGTVSFLSNGVVIGTAPVVNGIATLTVPAGTVAGNQNITAVFTGVGVFTPSTSTVTTLVVTVTPTLPDTNTPTLPDTGTDHLAALIAIGGATLLLGFILVLVTRPYASRHTALLR